MKILFIYPDILPHRPDWTGWFYTGIASLSAVLKKQGYETSLMHITKPVRMPDFIRKVEKESPELIGFSSTSPMFPLVREFASWLGEAKIKVPTVCGGIHPTIAPDEVIETDGIDIICRGEGEAPLAELCKKIENRVDISGIENLWIKQNGNTVKNPLRGLEDDLDSLPYPDRSIFAYPTLYHERNRRGSFMAGRGCPYNCTYCCNHLLRKIYGNHSKPVRFKSVDNLIGEIKQVTQQYPFINKLIFDDDILFLKREWAEEFAEKYSKQINLPFVCNARANVTNAKMVSLLKKAGCSHVKFGLESGNEYISNQVLNRHLTNETIKKAFAICKEAGMITESFNMVGIPYDTSSTILDTIKLNAEIGVNKMQISIYQPYKGTGLADLCREKNFLVSGDLGYDWFAPVLKLDTISGSQVLMFRDYFKVLMQYYRLIMKLPKGLSSLLIRLSDRIISIAFTATVLNLFYIPVNFIYRNMFNFTLKARLAWRKRFKDTLAETKSISPNGDGASCV